MEQPKTRRETKKTAKEKRSQVYSSKHIRQLEAILEGRNLYPSNGNIDKTQVSR